MTRLTLMMSAAILAATGASPAFAGSGGYSSAPDLLPQNAQPGQCYARVKNGAQYADKMEVVVIEEGYESVEISPAQVRSATRSVKVKDESVRYVVRQPRYRSVTERVLTSPSYDRLSVMPPQFQTVTETLQTSGPRTVWKKGNPGKLAAQGYNVLSTANGGYGSAASGGSTGSYSGSYSGSGQTHNSNYAANGGNQCGPTCEIWCLVEVPGESVSYRRKVMTAPAKVVRNPVPAQYQTITKQVLADPGGVEQIAVPAEYRDITVTELVSPGTAYSVAVPPKKAQIRTKVLVKPETQSWARVICNTGQVVGHSGAVNYPAASGAGVGTGGGYSSNYNTGTYASGAAQTYAPSTGSAATGHSTQLGGSFDSGIHYGGQTSSRYSAKQPSALIYGSSNTPAPDYGISYDSPSQPRTYGGEGMNSHHSAGH